MKIYSMTATFGKLSRQTLELKPGLNIIEAPNEWGKSTWCAFLAAMLYGLDTRAKSTKHTLADKERYAPWSGSPMAGRIELNWQGRDITIERTTKGRIPLGEFRAYETASGLPVPELTAANCGKVLLGVERSVFLRSGFIRFQDLPVTNDDALRRRLNALVTTGDENGGLEKLAAGLKELKNRCRYNRTGLIPQAEAEKNRLEEKLWELEDLERNCAELESRLADTEERTKELENHKAALDYEDALRDRQQVERARGHLEDVAARLRELEENCAELPDREEIQRKLDMLRRVEEEIRELRKEQRMLEDQPPPVVKPAFADLASPEELAKRTRADGETYRKLTRERPLWWALSLLLMLAGAVAARWYPIAGIGAASVGAIGLLVLIITGIGRKKAARAMEARYGCPDPVAWLAEAERYRNALSRQEKLEQQRTERIANVRLWLTQREEKCCRITQGMDPDQCCRQWEEALAILDSRLDAKREHQRARSHLESLEAMAREIPAPPGADALTLNREQTQQGLARAREEKSRLQNRLNQYSGRMETLGSKAPLLQQLEQVKARLRRLEETYEALVLAQETLAQASAELQRRFAPRIAKQAAQWMSALTGGKYDRLQLSADLSLLAGGSGEDTLREVLWRSDGTVDQLYLALRLAVAEELMPQGPLILDDALIRFDDVRLKAALELLKREGERKQVLLFTCHSRENQLLK